MSNLQREAEDIRESHDGSIKWLIDLSPDEALRLIDADEYCAADLILALAEVERLREQNHRLMRYGRKAYEERIKAAERKLAKVLEGYEVAVSDILDWAAYASDYFIKKHDLAGVVERHQTIIKEARDE